MSMTHAPETGTENWYQKTCTSFRHGVEHCSTPYQILVPEKIDTDSYDTPTCRKLVQVFWYGFSVPVSGACVIGISRHENRACPIRYQKLVPEKFGTKLHVKNVRNSYRFSGTGFWHRFLVSVSWALSSQTDRYRYRWPVMFTVFFEYMCLDTLVS